MARPPADERWVAHAIVRDAAELAIPFVAKHSSDRGGRDDRCWAIATVLSSLLDRRFPASTETSCVGTERDPALAAALDHGLPPGPPKQSRRCGAGRCRNSSLPAASPTPARHLQRLAERESRRRWWRRCPRCSPASVSLPVNQSLVRLGRSSRARAPSRPRGTAALTPAPHVDASSDTSPARIWLGLHGLLRSLPKTPS